MSNMIQPELLLNSSSSASLNKAACLACREKKLKCNKVYPICSRCQQKSTECIYVSHKKKGPKPSSNSKSLKLMDSRNKISKLTKNDNFIDLKVSVRNSTVQPSSNQSNGRLDQDDQKLIDRTNANVFKLSPIWKNVDNQLSTVPKFPPTEAISNDFNRPSVEGDRQPHLRSVLTDGKFFKLLQLDEFPELDLNSIDKLHLTAFKCEIRPFRFSAKRYIDKFNKNPEKVLFLSFMIWATVCSHLPEYSATTICTRLYEKACSLIDKYWEDCGSTEFDSMYYLQCLTLKAHFEFRFEMDLKSALTICCIVRLSQMFGYDQLDASANQPNDVERTKLSTLILSKANSLKLEDDQLDEEISLIEESRRTFWEIYVADKWYSLVTGLPSAFSIDSNTVIFTLLPSPTTFLSLTDNSNYSNYNSNSNNDNNDNNGTTIHKYSTNNSDTDGNSGNENDVNQPLEKTTFYLHEAMHQLQRNHVMIDMNSLSSIILLMTISENIIKWSKMFLYVVDLETLKNEESVKSVQHKIDELVKNFEDLQTNLLLIDFSSNSSLTTVVVNDTVIVLYQAVLMKFGKLFELHQSVISIEHSKLFRKILKDVSLISSNLIRSFIDDERFFEVEINRTSIFIVLTNSLKSIIHVVSILIKFEDLLNDDNNDDSNDDEGSNDLGGFSQKDLLDLLFLVVGKVSNLSVQSPNTRKLLAMLEKWTQLLNESPGEITFFDYMT